MRSMATIIGVAALLQTVATPRTELLTKKGLQGDAKYYGHVKATDKSTFVTCQGGELTIQPGTVEPTPRQCSDPGVGPLIGSVTSVDIGVGRFVVTDSNGNRLAFTLAPAEQRTAQRLGVGRNVTISGSGSSRVIAIQ